MHGLHGLGTRKAVQHVCHAMRCTWVCGRSRFRLLHSLFVGQLGFERIPEAHFVAGACKILGQEPSRGPHLLAPHSGQTGHRKVPGDTCEGGWAPQQAGEASQSVLERKVAEALGVLAGFRRPWLKSGYRRVPQPNHYPPLWLGWGWFEGSLGGLGGSAPFLAVTQNGGNSHGDNRRQRSTLVTRHEPPIPSLLPSATCCSTFLGKGSPFNSSNKKMAALFPWKSRHVRPCGPRPILS